MKGASPLRTVLRVRDACWGYICLHREVAQATFSRDEARFVQRLAEGLRTRDYLPRAIAGVPRTRSGAFAVR